MRKFSAVGLLKRRGVIIFLCGIGLAVTIFWFSLFEVMEYARRHVLLLLLCLGYTITMTSFNLFIRWLRWHFLMRRTAIRLPAKDSLMLYLITLPAILTPFYLGELIRAVLLKKRHPNISSNVFSVWGIERFSDLMVLLLFLVTAQRQWSTAIVVIASWLLGLLVIKMILKINIDYRFSDSLNLIVILVSTSIAWVLPIVALWWVIGKLAPPVSFSLASSAFSYSTILGGFTGLPLGIGVTGSSIIMQLQKNGIVLPVAVTSIAVLRTGTAWFAIGLGFLSLIMWKRRVLNIIRPTKTIQTATHFDEIADYYEEQIPSHIRERLLKRKIEIMQYWLTSNNRCNMRGLDIGCGQGWYACEMAEQGHKMSALDQSKEQIAQARKYAKQKGVIVDFKVADAAELPYEDNYFDFAYAINIMHHITNKNIQDEVFKKIIRVLKTNGVFFLQEINTQNPLFRFYMGYVFPLISDIDEGTELWINPKLLPVVQNARWVTEVNYFTFLPDFMPVQLINLLSGFEAYLEKSMFRHWSAHYVARLVKK